MEPTQRIVDEFQASMVKRVADAIRRIQHTEAMQEGPVRTGDWGYASGEPRITEFFSGKSNRRATAKWLQENADILMLNPSVARLKNGSPFENPIPVIITSGFTRLNEGDTVELSINASIPAFVDWNIAEHVANPAMAFLRVLAEKAGLVENSMDSLATHAIAPGEYFDKSKIQVAVNGDPSFDNARQSGIRFHMDDFPKISSALTALAGEKGIALNGPQAVTSR